MDMYLPDIFDFEPSKSVEAVLIRDAAWQYTDRIPSWVRGRKIDLDQYNTLPEVASYCWNKLKKYIKTDGATLSKYKIIEPSAGTGAFYNLLPKDDRIGIDIVKYNDEYIQKDFLTWAPNTGDKPCIVVGNPPFGYRGWLALSFLNKAAEFSDYVGFILPMSFQSDGKGSPKNRVRGLALVHSEKLPEDVFILPNGEKQKVNTLWQIWKKGPPKTIPDLSICNNFIDLFTVDKRQERLCGMNRINGCDIFLQRTYFGDPPKLVNDFKKVKYGCGYGIIIKRDMMTVKKTLSSIDWNKYSNLATHNCRHISMYHIKQALLDNYINK